MGCCSSSPNGTEIQNLKENADELQALKGKEEQLRPASSTVMKNGELIPSRSVTPRSETPDELGLRKGKSKRGKPSGLRVGGSKQLRDPNMIVTTPMNGDHDAFPSRPDDTILPTDKREAVAMFVSWEKPALGKKKRGGKKGGKKRSKTMAPKCATQAKKQQVFIPGSGNEKILLADKSKTLTKLPPLKFNKVEASNVVKSSVAADRKKAANQKKQVANLNKLLKNEMGFDDKICKLIRQYAEITKPQKKEVEVEMVLAPKKSNHSRTSYACPVKE